jgi:hypothetical protein
MLIGNFPEPFFLGSCGGAERGAGGVMGGNGREGQVGKGGLNGGGMEWKTDTVVWRYFLSCH